VHFSVKFEDLSKELLVSNFLSNIDFTFPRTLSVRNQCQFLLLMQWMFIALGYVLYVYDIANFILGDS